MGLVSSDFSFAERVIIDVWIWLWFIYRVWSTDRFASLQWSKICNFDLKSIITLLIFLMLPVQAIFDIAWTYIKYNEGFITDPSNNKIYYTKPIYDDNGLLWSKENLLLKTFTEYLLAFCFAFQIGTLALMQAFWSHLSSQMGGKPFMRTWKFRFYVGWVFASMFIFPLARALTTKNEILIETIPQSIYATQMFIIFLLGIKNGKRLNGLLKSIQHTRSPSGQETILRIHYFIEMNESLMVGALFISIGILSSIFISLYGNHSVTSKLLLDMFIIHVNFGSLILWVTMILIIYPRYYITGTSGAVLVSSTPTTVNGQTLINGRHVSGEPSTPTDKLAYSRSNSYIINLNTPTTATFAQPSSPTKSIANSSIYNKSVEKSINSLLEEQKQQIEIFRHKTSTSISSIKTIESNYTNASTFPIIPPPPLLPPPKKYPMEDIQDVEVEVKS
ncbi:unnamed protein product [Rhizophagus irregularis]|nr:unnamed protein product [Rhizophagus irregularis]CAB5367814.1 unnamed protein product [Rhizophagus irregularis]